MISQEQKEKNHQHYLRNKVNHLILTHNWKKTYPKACRQHKAKSRAKPEIRKHEAEYTKDYRAKNRPTVRKWGSNWLKNPVNNKKNRIRLSKWRKENPEKVRAEQAARGIIIPEGQICQECNKQPASKKHHPDYSKPFEVKFLCTSCHNKIAWKEKKKED